MKFTKTVMHRCVTDRLIDAGQQLIFALT